jgi:hypothetical protein
VRYQTNIICVGCKIFCLFNSKLFFFCLQLTIFLEFVDFRYSIHCFRINFIVFYQKIVDLTLLKCQQSNFKHTKQSIFFSFFFVYEKKCFMRRKKKKSPPIEAKNIELFLNMFFDILIENHIILFQYFKGRSYIINRFFRFVVFVTFLK